MQGRGRGKGRGRRECLSGRVVNPLRVAGTCTAGSSSAHKKPRKSVVSTKPETLSLRQLFLMRTHEILELKRDVTRRGIS